MLFEMNDIPEIRFIDLYIYIGIQETCDQAFLTDYRIGTLVLSFGYYMPHYLCMCKQSTRRITLCAKAASSGDSAMVRCRMQCSNKGVDRRRLGRSDLEFGSVCPERKGKKPTTGHSKV
jgi:hypothetical protein